jgi:dihydropteroate synthase
MKLNCKGRVLNLTKPRVMGVLNVTPDSFSDGGRFLNADAAVAHGLQMAEDGAAILDVGGESTRPGAQPVSAGDEMARVVPVIERLAASMPVPISVDTSKPAVMRAAVGAGAAMINDVYALCRPGALEAAAELDVAVCLMHMQGEPRTMQVNPHYQDVVNDIKTVLRARIADCEAAGIARERILVDPGFGFGKTYAHNLELLRRLPELLALGRPLLVGFSRKSMLGRSADLPSGERLHTGIAAAALAAWLGALIIRTHDVKPTVEALSLVEDLHP